MSGKPPLTDGARIVCELARVRKLGGTAEAGRDGPASREQLAQRFRHQATAACAGLDDGRAHSIARGEEAVLGECLRPDDVWVRSVGAATDQALDDRGQAGGIRYAGLAVHY